MNGVVRTSTTSKSSTNYSGCTSLRLPTLMNELIRLGTVGNVGQRGTRGRALWGLASESGLEEGNAFFESRSYGSYGNNQPAAFEEHPQAGIHERIRRASGSRHRTSTARDCGRCCGRSVRLLASLRWWLHWLFLTANAFYLSLVRE